MQSKKEKDDMEITNQTLETSVQCLVFCPESSKWFNSCCDWKLAKENL